MSFVYLGSIGLGNWPHVLGNMPHLLGNGPLVLGSMLYSGLCRIRDYAVRNYVVFRIMSSGIMSHSGLCRIRTYVVRDNVVWHNVGVSFCFPKRILQTDFVSRN